LLTRQFLQQRYPWPVLITRNTKDFPAQMPGIRIPYTL
jgi:hypothetical protein